jgi:hypothetical protein
MENPFNRQAAGMANAPTQPAPADPPAKASEPLPAVPLKASMADDHSAISMAIFAGACANVVIALAKARWGVDFSGQEGNLTILVMGITGYMTKKKQGQ